MQSQKWIRLLIKVIVSALGAVAAVLLGVDDF